MAQKLIEGSKVRVNNELVTKCKTLVSEKDKIEINYSKKINTPYANVKIDLLVNKKSNHYIFKKPSFANEIHVLYETSDFLIINKGSKVLSHFASTKTQTPNVVDTLKKEGFILKGGKENRQGIVHRLDEDTKGLMILSKTLDAYNFLQKAFKEKAMTRYYLTLVKGEFNYKKLLIQGSIINKYKKAKMEVSLLGKKASTYVQLINVYSSNDKHYSLLACRLNTGRTHQIRIHLSTLGYPVINDTKYGEKTQNQHPICLHSSFLGFTYKKEYSFISLPFFKNQLNSLAIEDWGRIKKEMLGFLKNI